MRVASASLRAQFAEGSRRFRLTLDVPGAAGTQVWIGVPAPRDETCFALHVIGVGAVTVPYATVVACEPLEPPAASAASPNLP